MSRNRPPTIKTVAAAAGVSTGTVSRVINNRPAVSPAAERVVRQAMARLKYQPPPPQNRRGPKPAAPGQTRPRTAGLPRRTNRIALVVLCVPQPALQSPIYSELINGVHAGLRAAEQTLVVKFLDQPDPDLLRGELRHVDGAVLFCAPGHESLIDAQRGGCCVQVFGQIGPGEWWDHVTYRNAAVGPLAAQWLASRGHRHVAYLGSGGASAIFAERHRTFMQASPGAQAFTTPQLVAAGQVHAVDPDRLAELVDALLRARPRPTGLFVPADMEAVATHCLLLQKGVVPGRDLEIISCNHEKILLAGLRPRPVSIDIHAHDVGRRAAEQVLYRLSHRDEPPVQLSLEPQIPRESQGGRFRRATAHG